MLLKFINLIKNEKGAGIGEILAAVAILPILVLMIGAGAQQYMKTQAQMTVDAAAFEAARQGAKSDTPSATALVVAKGYINSPGWKNKTNLNVTAVVDRTNTLKVTVSYKYKVISTSFFTDKRKNDEVSSTYVRKLTDAL